MAIAASEAVPTPASTSTGTINISGGILTANGPLSVNTLNLSAGTLQGSGAVTLNGAGTWTGGTYTGTGQLIVSAGQTLTIADLLYGIMLSSANDAAVVLAEGLGGSVEQFADMIVNHYPELFAHDGVYGPKSRDLAARTFELSQFLVDVLGVEDVGATGNGTIAYHASPLVTAVLTGGICVLDEGNRMNEKSWASLASLLDHRRCVESIIAGIQIRAHEDFRCCVTMNQERGCGAPPVPRTSVTRSRNWCWHPVCSGIPDASRGRWTPRSKKRWPHGAPW